MAVPDIHSQNLKPARLLGGQIDVANGRLLPLSAVLEHTEEEGIQCQLSNVVLQRLRAAQCAGTPFAIACSRTPRYINKFMVQADQPSNPASNSFQGKWNHDPPRYSASRIAGTYLIAGFLWIGLSDMTLAWGGGLSAHGFLVAVGKGLVFVILSAGLVFELSRREYRNSARTTDLLRAVVEGTTDAVFVKDRSGRYQLVNEAAARFIGLPVADVLGRNDWDLLGSREAEQIMDNDIAIMSSGEVTTRNEMLTSGGVSRTYHSMKAPYFDAKGQVVGLVGISRDISERALIESSLQETEARLKESQRIAKLGSWGWNPQTNHVWWSEAEFELFGMVPNAIRPSFEAFLELLHPDDRPIAISRVDAMLGGAVEFANDLRVLRADGTWMWIHSQARATRDATGTLVRVEGTDQDITEQHIARETALESEGRLQAAVEVAGLGVIEVDYERQIAKLSPRAAEQFGLSAGANISRVELHSYFHPADVEELTKAIDKALTPGGSGSFSLEHRVVRSDGSTRWLNVRKQVSFEDDRPIRSIIVTADVTDQREAQASLREQEMLVREAAELAKVGGWGFDPITLKSDWTPTVAEMYGVAHDSPPTIANALDYFSAEFRPALEKALAASVKDGVPHDMELQLLRSNGEKKWVRTICRPIMENGRVIRVRGSLQDISDRKRAEEELRASEERYRLLFESNPHPMWVYDVDSLRFLAVNDAAVQSYGYSREEFLAMTIRDIRPAEELAKLEMHIARTVRGLSRSTTWKHRRKNGSVFDVEVASHDLPEDQGHVRLVLALDVTDRKRAEQAREVATQRLSKFASQLPGAIFLYSLGPDNSYRVPYCSDKIEAILGIGRDLLKADAVDAFAKVHVEDYDSLQESIRKSAQRLTPLSREFRVVHDDGTTRWISCDAVPERESDGSTLWHGYMKDVTETHEAALELQDAKSRLEEAQALARIGSWSYDVLNNTHRWSKQMYKIFKFEDLTDRPDYQKMLDSLIPEDALKLDALVKTAIAEGTPYSLVVRMQQPHSDVSYVRCEGRTRRDSEGMIVGLYGTSAEVTAEIEREQALKVARNQADAANRAKSEFLANMSHEIRTPLTAILGFTDVLRDDGNVIAPQQWIHHLDTITKAGQHLLTIINDILDLSKIEADKAKVELIETHWLEVLCEVERLLRPNAIGKGLVLSSKLSTPVPDRILSDPTRLRQILLNLVGNAVKFTEAGTIVINASVTESHDHASLVIDIEDTGQGMSEVQAQSLFLAFEQADNTVTRKYGGTGLGLNISRRLSRLMGGDVTLMRTTIGKGSCFRLVLPLIPVDGSVQVNCIPSGSVPNIDVSPERIAVQGRILLAEDGLDNQRLIAFLLRKAGATVDVADDGEIALEFMDKANESKMPYDLLITDMQMPVMDGYTLANTLRGRGMTIPIVALTAHAQVEDRQKCLEAGCDDYLSKPIDKNSLLTFCAKWIAMKR